VSWTRLVYGTAIITALAGTAIYYGATRSVIRPIDIVELSEGANERLMPFGYSLVTNTLIYEQARWTVDPSTNRWQLGTNQMPYLVFDGLATVTDRFINVSGIASQANERIWANGDFMDGSWYFWWSYLSVPGPEDFLADEDHHPQWTISCVQTGRTFGYNHNEADSNELPAYVIEVHPRGVGVYNAGSTLDGIDASLLGVVPRYVDHEAAVAGVFTGAAIPMLTCSSVWTRLQLPYIWTNVSRTITNTYTNWVDSWTNATGVTNVIRIGTNQAWQCSTNITTNYVFTTGAICTTNMLWRLPGQTRFIVMP
jgi:hypothetical protein